jgi:thiamine biosynthesis lipoprotein
MSAATPIPEAIQLTHEAMNTVFSLWLRNVSPTEAPGIALMCWDVIDRLENQLSRFIDTSDIARINCLAAGETLYLNEDTHRCLLLGLQAYTETNGLFDITLGTRIEHRKSGAIGPPPEPVGRVIIHPDIAAVTCAEPGRVIDLGGIGKGYALDRAREVLADWGAEDALVAAGASSMLAFGPSAWPVELTGRSDCMEVLLTNNSLSASGTIIQGDHIVHPGGDWMMSENFNKHVWILAETASAAEVASTTLMLVSPDEAPNALAGITGVSSAYLERNGRIIRIT